MIHIVLFEPEIPQNTGNIMRTCAGTGTKLHLIQPLGFSLEEKYVKRSAMDYYDDVEFVIYENFEEFLSKNEGEMFFLTRYGKKAPSQFSYAEIKKDIYLIFGKESTGLPYSLLADHLDHCIRIPTNDKVRSLNLSNCAAIMLFEVLRQLEYPNLLSHEPDTLKGADFLNQFHQK